VKKEPKTDFEIFKNECRKWIKFFGLTEWEIDYAFVKDDEKIDAWVTFDEINGMLAVICMNALWKERDETFYTLDNVKKAAFHEVCEVLIAKIIRLASARYCVSEDELTLAKHELIRRLENTLYKEVIK
jgi:hypothetical protein